MMTKGPDLLDSEIKTIIEDLKNRKAVGMDGMPVEFWKNLGKEGTSELVDINKRLYEVRIHKDIHNTFAKESECNYI